MASASHPRENSCESHGSFSNRSLRKRAPANAGAFCVLGASVGEHADLCAGANTSFRAPLKTPEVEQKAWGPFPPNHRLLFWFAQFPAFVIVQLRHVLSDAGSHSYLSQLSGFPDAADGKIHKGDKPHIMQECVGK